MMRGSTDRRLAALRAASLGTVRRAMMPFVPMARRAIPWALLAGGAAAGFAVGRRLARGPAPAPPPPAHPPAARGGIWKHLIDLATVALSLLPASPPPSPRRSSGSTTSPST